MIEHLYASLDTEVKRRLETSEWVNAQILDIGIDQSSGTVKTFVLNAQGTVDIKYMLLSLNAESTAYVVYEVNGYIEKGL